MSVQENIRRLDSQGVPGREIARTLGISRHSVARYADQQDFSPAPPVPSARPGASVLTGFDHIIEQWLGEDQRRPRFLDRISDEVTEGWLPPQGIYDPLRRWMVEDRSSTMPPDSISPPGPGNQRLDSLPCDN